MYMWLDMWSGCGRTIKDIQRSKCESLPGSSTKDIYRPKCESLPGTSVKFNNTYFLNDTINNQNGLSHRTGTYKRRRRAVEVCACGDVYCNYISNFLGYVVTEKCHYKRPSLCDEKTSQKKLKRNRIIHKQVKMWRKLHNSRFRKDQISVTPSNSVRFNEIHFPILFLKELKRNKRKVYRIPMEVGVDLAKRTNMFSDEFVYDKNNKTTVLTIPTLDPWETIQVHYYDTLTHIIDDDTRRHIFKLLITKQDRITNSTTNSDVVKTPTDGSPFTCPCQHCFFKELVDDILHKNIQVRQFKCLQPFHMMVVERNVFVWSSTIHGHGLFARKKLKPFDIICLYSGDLHNKDWTISGDFTCQIDQGFIDSSDRWNNFSGRWMNHSCSPNARLVVPLGGQLLRCPQKGRVAILVECVKMIYPFEEICIDYGKKYFTSDDRRVSGL